VIESMIAEKTKRIRFSEAAAVPAKLAARQLAAFTIGLLCSRSVVFGQYAPFGVAAVAAAPYSVLFSLAFGSAIGCMLPSGAVVPVHYLAAVIAAAAIRWALNDLVKLRMHPLFAPAAAFLPLLTTSIAVSAVSSASLTETVMYVSEALLAGTSAYFFRRSITAVESERSAAEWTPQEIACGAFTVSVLLLFFSELTLWGVSVGRILAILAVLFAARYGGVAGGSIAGVTAGLTFSLATSGLNYVSGAYALGGLVAGLFSPLGRLASAAAFVLSNGIASLQVGNQKAVIIGLYEVAAATVIYLMLPAKTGRFLVGVFSRREDGEGADGLRKSVVMKLDFAAKALEGVSSSVEEVSRRLEQTTAPDISGVYNKAIEQVCRTCGLKGYCWNKSYNKTMDAFNNLTPTLREKRKVERDDFREEFRSHCGRVDRLAESINRRYADFCALEAAESRAKQIRSMVAEQFTITGSMLEDMASEMEMCEKYDPAASQKASEVLRLAGIQPMSVSCRIDRFGHMSAEAVTAPPETGRINRAKLSDELSRACGRQFDMPAVTMASGKCRIRINERAAYKIKTGCAQHICGNGKLCGDCWTSFPDGSGRVVSILCDGMGTGGRAAVDGAMASGIMERLVKAGIGFDTGLRIVNSALVAKSGDESLSTMDVSVIDLYTGEVTLLKAGAPGAVIRKKGHAVLRDTPGLPIGILNEASFNRSADTLSDGDLLVMLSDGALSSGSEWICEEVEKWDGTIPQELAETIVSKAIARRSDGHDDDITALVLMMCKVE
jgi:stage II sporulation protein E